MYTNAKECWEAIPGLIEKALEIAPKDFVALECCANGLAYAKPDTQKWLLLWEAKRSARAENGREFVVEIDYAEDVPVKHQWMYELFVQKDFVRFPCNTGDCDGRSIDWNRIDTILLRDEWQDRVRLLPRFSTASRSNLALIPETYSKLKSLPDIDAKSDAPIKEFEYDQRPIWTAHDSIRVNLTEWRTFADTLHRHDKPIVPRACQLLTDIGEAVSETGMSHKRKKMRLYSVKTGVSYVGSTVENSKQKLESNSMLAMLRSKVIRKIPHRDPTFDIQTELLTVLAPMAGEGRDGFQVRDLSCMRSGLSYLPAQAIPYVNGTYNKDHDVDAQVAFWRRNFAVPMGRAKACLFLKYGLIHKSANAQNFVLGFNNGNELRHFVVRDIGDTSWHDVYIQDSLRLAPEGAEVYRYFLAERGRLNSETLEVSSDPSYPPPLIVRLAANSVLTHKFGEKMKASKEEKGSEWQVKHAYKFASGVLDGFREYIQEAFELDPLYPDAPERMGNDQIRKAGEDGVFPYKKEQQYKKIVSAVLQKGKGYLFNRASYIWRLAGALEDGGYFAKLHDPVSVLINAEELFLCAGVEKLLRERQMDRDWASKIRGRIDAIKVVAPGRRS